MHIVQILTLGFTWLPLLVHEENILQENNLVFRARLSCHWNRWLLKKGDQKVRLQIISWHVSKNNSHHGNFESIDYSINIEIQFFINRLGLVEHYNLKSVIIIEIKDGFHDHSASLSSIRYRILPSAMTNSWLLLGKQNKLQKPRHKAFCQLHYAALV